MNPVLKKLKIAEDARVMVCGLPEGLEWLFDGLEEVDEDPTVVFGFVPDRSTLAEIAPKVIRHYHRGRSLWMAYPKKSGRVRSDINRDAGWEPLSEVGLLPVMQIAINDDWSALRWRYRDEIKHLRRKF